MDPDPPPPPPPDPPPDPPPPDPPPPPIVVYNPDIVYDFNGVTSLAAWNAKVATIPGAISTFTGYQPAYAVGQLPGVYHQPDTGFGYLQVPLPSTHNKYVVKLEAVIDRFGPGSNGTVYVFLVRNGITTPVGQCTTYGVKTFEGFYQLGDKLEIREDQQELLSVDLVITIKHVANVT